MVKGAQQFYGLTQEEFFNTTDAEKRELEKEYWEQVGHKCDIHIANKAHDEKEETVKKKRKTGGGPKSKKSEIAQRNYAASEERSDDSKPPAGKFKFKGARFALTYTAADIDADVDKDALLEMITNTYKVKHYGICHEQHKCGKIHTHGVFWLEKQVCIGNARKFDIEHKGVWLHPNFKALNSDEHWDNWSDYIYKEDEEPLTNFKQGQNFNQCAQLIAKIEAHDTWAEVMRDPDICQEIQSKMCWAKAIFSTRRMLPEAVKWDKMHAYQLYVEKLLSVEPSRENSHRRIIWIWSKMRGTGKSLLIDHLVTKHDWTYLDGVFCQKDLLQMYQGQRVLRWEIQAEQELHNTMFTVLERFSDTGSLASGPKYMGEPHRMKSHIVVTSNHPPPFGKIENRIIGVQASQSDDMLIQDNWSKPEVVVTTKYVNGLLVEADPIVSEVPLSVFRDNGAY